MTRLRALVFVVGLLAATHGGAEEPRVSSGLLPDQEEAIKKVIRQCVDYARHMPRPNPAYGESYKHFDAFYHAANGLVQNNAFLNVDQEALYVFNKCMAEHGFALK